MEKRNSDIEQEMQHESNLRKYDAENAAGLELFKSVISTGQSALKSVIMLNGGAAVALLAFVGTTWNKLAEPTMVRTLLVSMVLFVVGALFGGIAASFTYLVQSAYLYERTKAGNVYNRIAIFLVAVAYVLFIVAFWVAVRGFWKHLPSYCV